ncbi:MAG: Dabb family protein [Chthoniobacterales bacterium]|nr:Dabb family protein [Chthoniobacterales bacterium]
MIHHTALFTFNETATKAQIAELMDSLLALQKDIPAIKRIVWGRNFSQKANGYTDVVSIDFPSRETLAAFYDHPAHKRVAERLIKPITKNLLIVDYEEKGLPEVSARETQP